MNPVLLGLVALLALLQVALPFRLAFLPLAIAGCSLGNVEVLPELTPARLLIVIGLGRAISNQAFAKQTWHGIDVVFGFFSLFSLLSSFGHKADAWSPSPLSAHLGLILNVLGVYLYGRAYLPDMAAFKRFACLFPLVLLPLAISMSVEVRTGKNYYYLFGAINDESTSREGKIRAQGPFRGPITAGSLGATTLPLAYVLWMSGRKFYALLGVASCLGVVLGSNSSGPLAALAVTFASITLWRWRSKMPFFICGALLFALAYGGYYGRGPWYIMSSIDLVGGSTGYFRAELIDQSVRHLDEWWLWGTDYTRHWMPTGVTFSPNHTDITNYYLHLGIIGGFPLMSCLFLFILKSYRMLARRMAELRPKRHPDEIVLWIAGTVLTAHAISFVSISYYDQMYIYFYLLIGAMPGLVSRTEKDDAPAMQMPDALSGDAEPVAKPLRYYS